jgi:hypothetical protein
MKSKVCCVAVKADLFLSVLRVFEKGEEDRKAFLKIYGGLVPGWRKTILATCEKAFSTCMNSFKLRKTLLGGGHGRPGGAPSEPDDEPAHREKRQLLHRHPLARLVVVHVGENVVAHRHVLEIEVEHHP